jgi:hypothetical protein
VSYQLSRFSGSLYAIPASDGKADSSVLAKSPAKINRALSLCRDPYRIRPMEESTSSAASVTSESEDPQRGVKIANRLVNLCRRQFWLAHVSASFHTPLFENSAAAISFFRRRVNGDQATLCFPRALFAAKTSKAFAASGVVFIGVFLPARSMHAWVIEGDAVADASDDIWINHEPVAVLV